MVLPNHACLVLANHARPQGSKLTPIPKQLRKVWTAGGTANVTWAFVANHAGGYSYSLCPAAAELTEACFETTPLQFVDDTTTLRYMFLEADGTMAAPAC